MQDNILSFKTERILQNINNIYGINECKKVLENYDIFIKMKKANKIEMGNYNVMINDKSEFNESEKLVEIIWKILICNNVITLNYRYIEKDELRRNRLNRDKEPKEIQEQVLVIDINRMDTQMSLVREDIKKFMKDYSEKIFIIINNEPETDKLRDIFFDDIIWKMKIEKINETDKINYIQEVLKTNSLKIDNTSSFINCLAKEQIWKIKEELLNIIINCKYQNIENITDYVLKYNLNCKYIEDKVNTMTGIEELNSMIGIETVKNQILQVINYIKINKKRDNLPMLHMAFEGNPGTGKTTVARIVGKIFAEENLLSNNKKFVEAQRYDLIGEYVGQTAPKTKKVIEEADGGVLFIDEAYSISSYIQNEARGDYGQECISTLLKELEDKRNSLCVIMAGYTDEMEKMFKVNPGFESRIQFKINFPDYSEYELYEIFKKFAKKENYKMSSNIKKLLIEKFVSAKENKNFSNARYVRNLYEKVKFEQADRVSITNENINIIKKCDIIKAIEKSNENKINKHQIGFKK